MIRIPSWKYHVKRAKRSGVDGKTAYKVTKFLDMPPIPGAKHKSLHNPIGLMIIGAVYGRQGMKAAAIHMWDDYTHAVYNKILNKIARGTL